MSLQEVLSWLRDVDILEQADVERQIASARDYVEKRIERALMPQTWLLALDAFPAWEIELPQPPLISVASVKYIDDAGDLVTLASSEYKVSTFADPGKITPAYGKSWPIARCEMDAVQVTYQAGYAAASMVPPGIKQAMRVLITARWEHRADEKLMKAVDDMLAVYWPGNYTATQPGE